jgi:hypothetical protein
MVCNHVYIIDVGFMGYSLFRWPGNWLAINDLAISTIEIGGEQLQQQ